MTFSRTQFAPEPGFIAPYALVFSISTPSGRLIRKTLFELKPKIPAEHKRKDSVMDWNRQYADEIGYEWLDRHHSD
jgi:hypothetical protein